MAGAAFLFFLINRFFGDDTLADLPGTEVSAIGFFKPDHVDWRSRFGQAKSIALSGITLNRTSNTYLSELGACLDRGGKVRILLVDYRTPAMEAAAQRFYKHQDIDKIRREFQQSLDGFETLVAGRSKGKTAQIRLCSTVPALGIWLIDKGLPSAEIWAEIYSFRGNRDPAMELQPRRDGDWYYFFEEQYESLWNASVAWP